MKIVIKVGTQSILEVDGKPIDSVLNSIVSQISSLLKANHHVILVSSGAVGSGRKVAESFLQKQAGLSVGEKQLLASIGQPELMNIYSSLFKSQRILVSQLLLTKQDFQTRQHYLNIARLLAELLKHQNIIPIINENDSVAIEELMFTDNDELAGLIAAQIDADHLIILTNVDGVFTGDPKEPSAKLIKQINPAQSWPTVSTAKSTLGRGGMFSKLNIARKMSSLGIATTIANINTDSVITKIIDNGNIGTTILANRKTSNIKRWIALHNTKQLPSITINDPLFSLIKENKQILSILPIGIVSYLGEWKKGDLIDILNLRKEKIGIGLARYDVKRLEEYLGQKNKPAFIHYDQLQIMPW
ncbi:proB glutamate-5-kinase [Legionella beliardensis]|uniref:Glutamate 5-kinase n=1 Tax=Legionella beliardensis TaxID=91822 RepID=A0A378I2D9_9GAMM|nr:glutamate 5-kinase [Legionella beliardensis]STX28900.1 proB glutamate-5-kinase [Legionella beliardensis]